MSHVLKELMEDLIFCVVISSNVIPPSPSPHDLNFYRKAHHEQYDAKTFSLLIYIYIYYIKEL